VIVFDLDGTLIDNEEAVRYAYLRAGVVMPQGAWGKPVGDWCTKEQHKQKQTYYFTSLAEYGRKGLAIPYWDNCNDNKRVITGASKISACESLDFLGIPHAYLALYGASIREKIAWIKGVMTSQSAVYIDSDPEIAKEIEKETWCSVIVPGFK
jgi:hypothetical protein